MAKANVVEDTEAEEEEEEDTEVEVEEEEQEEEDHLLHGGIPTPREDSSKKLPKLTSQ